MDIRMHSCHKLKKWNIVALGGNDNFNAYPNEDRHEEWYSIDNLVVRDSLPGGLV